MGCAGVSVCVVCRCECEYVLCVRVSVAVVLVMSSSPWCCRPWVVYLDGCQISDISAGAFQGSLPSGVFLNNNKMTAIPEVSIQPS